MKPSFAEVFMEWFENEVDTEIRNYVTLHVPRGPVGPD